MKNDNIKITSFDYATTMSVVNGMKVNANKSMLAESTAIEEAKKIGTVGYIGANHMNLSRIMVESIAEKALVERCFVNSLGTIFTEAIPLDESFKKDKTTFLNSYFGNLLYEGTDISEMIKDCSGRSVFLKNLVEACKKKASSKKKEVADNAIVKGETSKKDIEKQISKDEDLLAIDEYDASEVADIIKNKVTGVVQAEKDNNDKDMDMVEEITNQKALGENVAVARVGLEEHTLFKSIMINNCKQTLNETTKQGSSIEGYSTLNESGEISIDMDTMLMETVTEYTRLELFNTLKISNHSVRDMRNNCNKIAYQNISMTY